ncbi:VPLPA-CTERM sorting domain-containing protein [Methylophaga pinxianii]|uniref:VPLPA-CTERM sorting domain-containing protein n=1 Tax=Methylophaga pinxianii TaxID=2881052 RepID=UPI001CF21C39|nr:VPLPA-CTERM sorting domain-containing protein [Methylophaga pinxianii]MCB2427973.1 VPLPA-CTERM sorting domain-containing protein [Methylophaga pinxianii]UPH44463.1 VPLPA-CTERM sorting domain-containing protein [Methylophaga pinxianii]
MKRLMSILAVSSFFFASTSNAAIISSLHDGFENEGQLSSVLNYNSFTNWDVTDGTVDLIQNGNQWGIQCSTGSFCVDLDGSTGDAGILSTKDGFSAGKYKVSFELSGNQRGGPFDQISVLFGAGSLLNHLLLDWDENWHTYSFLVDLVDGDKLSFRNFGGDNVGAILDNVNVSAVPIPAAVWLFGSGLMGFLAMRRKMKNDQI